jgi:transposase
VSYYAGLDVSLEETAICIVDDAGRVMREARVASEPEALVAFFGACGMKMERVGLEACSLTTWLHAGLTEAGLAAICIEGRQAKAAMGARPNKTDRNDARGIAQIMRTGWYRAVHVKNPSCRAWRALLTARRMVLNKRRDVENGVRALLREAGLKVGTPSRTMSKPLKDPGQSGKLDFRAGTLPNAAKRISRRVRTSVSRRAISSSILVACSASSRLHPIAENSRRR